MTREQRKAHAVIWTVLGPALIIALAALLLLRPARPAPSDVPDPTGASIAPDAGEGGS